MRSLQTRVSIRVLPLLFLCYFVAYLDRANVAFVKSAMQKDIGLSDWQYGLCAGLFFVGYLLLEIPGAKYAERKSAVKWLSRILITWGLLTAWTGWVRTPGQFIIRHFLVGMAEAGFCPAVFVLLGHWFTVSFRGRAVMGFLLAMPLSMVVGSPLSLWIMGRWGWRWVFVAQGLPAVILGLLVLGVLDDWPWRGKGVGWLSAAEAERLQTEILRERSKQRAREGTVHRGSLRLAAVLFLANTAIYGFVFWLPTIASRLGGVSYSRAVSWAGVIFGAGALGMIYNGWRADRDGQYVGRTFMALVLGAVFLWLQLWKSGNIGMVFGMAVASFFLFAFYPVFWVLPTRLQKDSSGAIGFVNLVGSVGSFIGPAILGFLSYKSVESMLVFISVSAFTAGLMTVVGDGEVKYGVGSQAARDQRRFRQSGSERTDSPGE